MVRGPQTKGELRARAGRLTEFASVDQVEQVLEGLAHHAKGRGCSGCHVNRGVGRVDIPTCFQSWLNRCQWNLKMLAELTGARAEIAELKARITQLEDENQNLKQRLRTLGEVC